jgi:octaprenyl-diphosphate synthase
MMQATVQPAQPRRSPVDAFATIAREMDDVERILAGAIHSDNRGVAELVDYVSLYRGKRLRPALLLLVARACGRLTSAHPVLGAVIELIHTATLVHDDILDGALVRRHVATANARWGTQSSVLLGDYLFTHAFHLCTTLGNTRVCEIIGAATNRTCEAELIQSLHQGNLDLTEEEYLEIIDGKTAELISCSARLGALMSDMTEDVVEKLADFGRYVGMAFQIADDLLDVVGEEKTTGKSLGTDADQQKLTLPVIRLIHGANKNAASRVRQILTDPANHKRQALRACLEENGALAYTRATAEKYVRRAQEALLCLPASETRELLHLACDRVVNRSF